jgi:hypothetical protein
VALPVTPLAAATFTLPWSAAFEPPQQPPEPAAAASMALQVTDSEMGKKWRIVT